MQNLSEAEQWLAVNIVRSEHQHIDLSLLYFSYKIKTPWVKEHASLFAKNISSVEQVLQLPAFFTLLPEAKHLHEELTRHMTAIFSNLPPSIPELAEFLKIVGDKPTRLEESLRQMKPSDEFKVLVDGIVKVLALIEKSQSMEMLEKLKEALRPALTFRPELVQALNSLLALSLCSYWTTLEVLASDLWTAYLNNEPAENSVLTGKIGDDKQTPNLTNKMISLDLLRKYNFDVSNHMGDILRDKFDFTGVNGICSAYSTLFRQKNVMDKDLRQELIQIEQHRHVIIHRGAMADENFLKKTKLDLQVGNKVIITDSQLNKTKYVIAQAGMSLLALVDSKCQEMIQKKAGKIS